MRYAAGLGVEPGDELGQIWEWVPLKMHMYYKLHSLKGVL